MKKSLQAVALLVAAFATQTASAAIQYEFRQSTSSDNEAIPPTDCSGRAIIDGDRSRVEFLAGNAYPAGTYIISTNGSRTMTFVDPSRKAYVEINGGSVTAALGARKITIANKKVDTTKMSDTPTIAGLPTEHYRMVMSYDITIAFGNLPLTQTVKTIIDKWTTTAFGDVGETFLAGGALRTGNADLDELITAENSNIKGFALKQIVNVTTINNGPTTAQVAPLKVARTTSQTQELTITSVQPTAAINVATFAVPAAFHRADPLHDDTQKSPVQVLSMEPSGK